jgi:hypothetical protein
MEAIVFHVRTTVIVSCMNLYAKPKERKVGAQRPKISHLPSEIDKRTRKDRLADREAAGAERRDQKICETASQAAVVE